MNSYGKYEKNKHIPFGKTYHFKNALAPTKNRSLKSIKVFSRSNVIKLEKRKKKWLIIYFSAFRWTLKSGIYGCWTSRRDGSLSPDLRITWLLSCLV